MYITTNYDLIRKIQEAKSITLLPPKVEIAAYAGLTGICYAECNALTNILVGQDGVDTTIIKVATCLLTPIAIKLAIAGTSKIYDSLGLHEHTPQGTAEKRLIQLASKFQEFNIKTNLQLLLNSQEYKREYSLKKESIPGFIQTKFIKIPIYNSENEITELNLMQQHQIGSFKYTLSIAMPTEDKKNRAKQKTKVVQPAQAINKKY